jgi:hypothetical protein
MNQEARSIRPKPLKGVLNMLLGQVSLLSESVQTMCNDQFGTWAIGVVDVIALVGACLDVFWFDPPKMIDIDWRG